jgi:O-antigen ligase
VKPSRPTPTGRKAAPNSLRLAAFFLWLLVLVPPFLLMPIAKESFRQPKLQASEWLALASLAALAWGLRRAGRVRLGQIWRLPAVRVALPALAVATEGLAFTDHPVQVREGLIDLWIGGAALVGWSLLPYPLRSRLLRGLLWPASALALIGILQFHGLWRPLEFFGIGAESRLAVTSLAGNPGDLGAYLVLPALIAQAWLRRNLREGGGIWGLAAALVLSVYALLVTQTLAAAAALVAGSLVLWGSLLPRRRSILLLAGGAVLAVALAAAVPPLRHRLVDKALQASRGDWNHVLTGRLDGWRAALWMLEKRPFTGVGHGAYRPEFVPAKLDLLDRGVEFFPEQQTVFANAHNEPLEVAADWGVPGLLVLAWGAWVLISALRRPREVPESGALAWAGTAAILVLSLAYFPFRVALVAFPALLFLSDVLRAPAIEDEAEEDAGIPRRALATVLAVLLVLGLAGQTLRWRDRASASRLLRKVELLSIASISAGRISPQHIAANLEDLRMAAPRDPVEVGIPIARGTQYLFLDRPEPAERSYAEAVVLEPRPEGYLNLGRAQWLGGRREEARRNFQTALRLDPNLAREVPAGAL